MLIHINKNYFSRGKTGKGRFAQRLVKVWREIGVDVTTDSRIKADIALHIGRMNYKSKARKHVLRVGPANIDTNMNWKKINREKAASVKAADAIVYQSKYSRKIYHNLVCRPDKPEIVIFNGADPRDYNVQPYNNHFQYIFLASTRVWLKQKRLKTIIRSFLEADIHGSRLIVCGNTQGVERKYGDLNNLMFTGNISDMVLARMYKSCIAMIHLTFVDACPNSVVEAQVAGLPVIHTDQGGTKEIVKCGCEIKDKPFKYKPVDLNKPPKIDRKELISAMRKIIDSKVLCDNVEHLYIQNIARQYLNFFKKLL